MGSVAASEQRSLIPDGTVKNKDMSRTRGGVSLTHGAPGSTR